MKIPKQLNASKYVIDNSLKVVGLSNLNAYRSVSFPFSNNEPSNKIKTYESRFFENDSKPVPKINKICVTNNLDKSPLVPTDANSKKTLDSFLVMYRIRIFFSNKVPAGSGTFKISIWPEPDPDPNFSK